MEEPESTQLVETDESTPGGVVRLPKRSSTRRILLRDLGAQLPFGVAGKDGVLQKGFASKPWRGKEEREVGKIRTAVRADPTSFVTRLLGYMFTQVGSYNFEAMSDAEKVLVVSQMRSGDVLYLYVWLRAQCIGNEVGMDLSCPHCGRSVPYAADLNTLEVRCAEKAGDADWTYQLRDPFQIRGNEVKALKISPIRWSTSEDVMRAASGKKQGGVSNMDVLYGCIHGSVDGPELALAITDLDEMTKFDIERLVALLSESEVGPDLSVTDNCPACLREFTVTMEWAYNDFFSPSSQSPARTSS